MHVESRTRGLHRPGDQRRPHRPASGRTPWKLLIADVPRAPDDALAQPTGARIFTLLGELRRSAGTDELARRLELNPEGLVSISGALEEAGLVLRDQQRAKRVAAARHVVDQPGCTARR